MCSFAATFVYICLMALLANAAAKITNRGAVNRTNRIYGGRSVTIKEVPYLVQLRDSGQIVIFCGGALVNPTHVVTAAHCLDVFPITDLVIVGGASTVSEHGVQRKIVDVFVHPDYGLGHPFTHDVAVLRLDSPMEGENISPIELDYDEVTDGEFLQISGWGNTEEGLAGTVTLIRTARVAKIPVDKCKGMYSPQSRVGPTMICAASPGKDACRGDSGGPAVYHGKLTAIISWSHECDNLDYPGVYTAVRYVSAFIKNALKGRRLKPSVA